MHESCITDLRRKGASGRCPLCRTAHADLAPVQVLIDAALAYGQRQAFEQCFRLLSMARDLDPENTFVTHALGQMYEDGKGIGVDIARAQELFEEAYRGSEGKVAAHDLARLVLAQGNVRRAQQLCEESWKTRDMEIGSLLADIYLDQGADDQAIRVYAEVAASGSVTALTWLGILYKKQGCHSEAEKCYTQAWDAGSLKALYNLGILYRDLGNLDAARDCFKEAYDLGLDEASFNLAVVLQDLGSFSEAEQLLQAARHQGDKDASFNLASMAMHLGDAHSAQELFQEAQSRGHKDAAVHLAKVRFELGDLDAARAILMEESRTGNKEAERFLQYIASPDCVTDLFQEACRQLKRGETRRAWSLFQAARLHGDPDAGDVQSAMLKAAAQRGSSRNKQQTKMELSSEAVMRFCETPFTPIGEVAVGDHVLLHGLQSSGLQFNFRFGTVLEAVSSSGRYGVAIDGVEQRLAVRSGNLVPESIFRQFLPVKANKNSLIWSGTTSNQRWITTPDPDLAVGDRVWIHNMPGSPMDGRSGTVLTPISGSGRYAVDVNGLEESWAVHAENLWSESFKQQFLPDREWDEALATVEQDDIVAEGCLDGASAGEEMDTKLPIASSSNRGGNMAPAVVLLRFSRSPRSFRGLLAEAAELAACRDALAKAGLAWEHRSGAKMLIKPEHYEPALESLRLAGWSLGRQDVIVDVEMAEVVTGLLLHLPGRDNVYPRGRRSVPLAFSAASLRCEHDITVSKTFINIRIPSSMCSTEETGQRTQSTTDADKRKGKNTRRRRARGHHSGAVPGASEPSSL